MTYKTEFPDYPESDMPAFKPCKFAFDATPLFDGFSHGSKWNGFDNVCVTPQERDKIVAWFIADSASAQGIDEIEPMENGLISLGWGYCTEIVESE